MNSLAAEHILNARIENIPQELRVRPQWAAWAWEQRDGKLTKPPLNPATGRYARNNDPDTWGSFKAAQWRRQRDRLPGIGYMFHPDDPFAGVDLDGCRDPDTGEVAGWAWKVVKVLDSYTEVSPSQTGLKVFVCGELPPGRRRKGKIEMYDRGRFFTTTGYRLSGVSPSIQERQSELTALHRRVFGEPTTARPVDRKEGSYEGTVCGLSDTELVDLATQATNGEKFKRLWAGDASDYANGDNEGRSEADLALCSLLAFWCGPDEERIDRLFRASGLYRPKWDKRHYGDGRTYGQGTIANALKGRSEFWDTPRLRSRSKARRVRKGAIRA
jgi:putative DNA primase/helicase